MSNQKPSDPIRHRLADRIFHWVMALSIFVLGGTAFLPILGLKFDWLPIHWITGVVLTVSILYHLYRVIAVHGVWAMVPGGDDLREAARALIGKGSDGLKPAKYDAFQKGYHLATSVTVLAVVATGLAMLAKIDTSLWNRNPSLLSDQTWGIVYVAHGAGAMALVFLVMLHIYFGLLPEHRAHLSAMIRGRGPDLSRKGTK